MKADDRSRVPWVTNGIERRRVMAALDAKDKRIKELERLVEALDERLRIVEDRQGLYT